ncbi:hypothetical protein [Sphingopyxis sp. LC363]|jgi:hypothetical protein|nr:hypothetical protein [Sphingopyxis sp. LC363]
MYLSAREIAADLVASDMLSRRVGCRTVHFASLMTSIPVDQGRLLVS